MGVWVSMEEEIERWRKKRKGEAADEQVDEWAYNRRMGGQAGRELTSTQ